MPLIDHIILWLARQRGIPLYLQPPPAPVAASLGLIEILPIVPGRLAELDRGIKAMPTVMEWDKVAECLWPAPDRRYRVWIERAPEEHP